MLPPSLIEAPTTRAVWTGEALLIANPGRSDVALRRYVCDGPRLRRDDIP
jgi:hypothetical protein